MLSPQALIRGIIQRALPSPNVDSPSQDAGSRFWTYGENTVISLIRKSHALAEEGTYFTVNNAQTAIAPTFGTAFAAANPFLLVQNQSAYRLSLDYAALTAVVAGACTTAVGYTALAVVIDNILRYTSGGTNLTSLIVSPCMGVAAPGGIQVYCGAITANTASASARTVVGIRNIRPGVSTTVMNVIGDCHLLNFGGVEGMMNGSITVANASLVPTPLPPIVIGAGHSALIYLWYPVVTSPSAATYAPELGFWLR